ncbi:lipocalin family protein [Aureibacter tunicatorum]|uniref:Apolipoprotein D and lipocalin family protein n=1 Tax=Aureibacter tunicatorum TaxID=866807 RepID=A0AAE3XMD9_9BACT|nr:lipocalin family protein [Aureibacter tunicatorum]MDR6238658.1 apolipoprotein D and lipocalin family protein [Aureibacter tunicatorum]BDD05411.1 membrane protein [Aureibacter tunicatorum]
MKIIRWAILLLAGFVLVAFRKKAKKLETDLETVPYVDLEKYQGVWYEIASFPARFEKGCSNVSAEYTLNMEKGYVTVENKCYLASKNKWKSIRGRAFPVEDSGNSKLKVRFFWPFLGDYWIVALDEEDYAYAAVASPDYKYLWILSREKVMDEGVYQELLRELQAMNFDIFQLRKTDQSMIEE